MTKLYFKHPAESDLGEGVAFIEVTDGWPTRQVELYEKAVRWADEAHPEWLADQPLDQLGLDDEHLIGSDEFERAWESARNADPFRDR